MSKTLKDTIVTPIGTAKWLDIAKPNYKYSEVLGKYSIDVILTEAQVNELRPTLDALHEQAKEKLFKDAKDPKELKKLKTYTDAVYIKPDTDKDGEETGDFVIKFVANAAYLDKTTKEKKDTRPPAVVDAKKAKIDPAIVGRGSKVKVAFMVRPYAMASTSKIGNSLQLVAVQVIDLKQFNEDASAAFGEEEGYEGSEDDSGGAFNEQPKAPPTEGEKKGDF